MSAGHHTGLGVAFDFGEGFAATFADRRIALVFTHVRRVIPAALAFLAVGALDFDGQARKSLTWLKPIAFGGILLYKILFYIFNVVPYVALLIMG